MAGDRQLTARYRYVPLSMVVDVGEAWAKPNIFALTGPKDWRPQLSRMIFHETVHYWQYISHGYLVRLIEEDWKRLQHFDSTGDTLPPGKLRTEFTQPTEDAGFSPQDLVEAHARFWDVLVLGPPLLIELELTSPSRDISDFLTREQYEGLKDDGKIWRQVDANGHGAGYSSLSFDLAMRLAAGRYALPYLRLREETNDLVAAALFPLSAHFALHSESPADFYLALVKRLAAQVELTPGLPIEYAWRSLYDDAWKEAELLHLERYGSEFLTGQATIYESPLFHEHVGYRMAHTMLDLACNHLQENRPSDFLVGPAKMPSNMRAIWTLDYLIGCCGMTVSRAPDLLAFTAPPVVRFADGRTWILGVIFDQLPYKSSAPSTAKRPPPRTQVAEALLAVDGTWTDMQLTTLGL